MNKRTKPYSVEFRKLIIDQYNSGQSVKNLSIQFNVSQVSIYRWIQQEKLQICNNVSFTNTTDYHLLQKHVLDLKNENEILRKAIKILSKGS